MYAFRSDMIFPRLSSLGPASRAPLDFRILSSGKSRVRFYAIPGCVQSTRFGGNTARLFASTRALFHKCAPVEVHGSASKHFYDTFHCSRQKLVGTSEFPLRALARHCVLNNQLQAKYNLLTADFPCSQMLDRFGDPLESSLPLGNHVWLDLSFLDETRQFVVNEGRQGLAFLIIHGGDLILNTECGVDQSVYKRDESVGKCRATVTMERTDNVDILPDRLDFVGSRIEYDNPAFATLCQDAHSEGVRLVERNRIEGGVNAITSGFLQLLDSVWVLVLRSRERLAKSGKWARN